MPKPTSIELYNILQPMISYLPINPRLKDMTKAENRKWIKRKVYGIPDVHIVQKQNIISVLKAYEKTVAAEQTNA